MDIDTAVETKMGHTSETIDMNLAENADPDQSETPSLSILSQLTADTEFLNDVRFLDDFQKLLDKYEGTTSIRFQPDMLRFKQLNSKARQNFKKQYRRRHYRFVCPYFIVMPPYYSCSVHCSLIGQN